MANEVRLIDANALLEEREFFDCYECGGECEFGYIDVDAVKNAPTIDPESLRPKGRWERTGEADYKCSVCGFRFTSGDPIEMFPYCRCGCKMEG